MTSIFFSRRAKWLSAAFALAVLPGAIAASETAAVSNVPLRANAGAQIQIIPGIPDIVSDDARLDIAATVGTSVNHTLNLSTTSTSAVSAQTGCGASWMAYNQATVAIAPGVSSQVSITFNATGLAPATYSASACFFDGPLSVVEIPVTFTVGAAGGQVLRADTPALAITASQGQQFTKTLTLSNVGSQDVLPNIVSDSRFRCWPARPGPAALIYPGQGNALIIPANQSASMPLAVDTSGLLPGVYTSAACYALIVPLYDELVIPVTVTVTAPPADGFQIDTSAINAQSTVGETVTQSIIVSNVGSQLLSTALADDPTCWPGWVQIDDANISLSVGTSKTERLYFSAKNLVAGTYTGNVCLENIDSHRVIEIPVTFNVLDRPDTVTATTGAHGSVTPHTQVVAAGALAYVTFAPDAGYVLDANSVAGTCGATNRGIRDPNTYRTNPVNASCTVTANFIPAR